VKFSRHAKNRIRLLGFRLADVEAVVSGSRARSTRRAT